MKLGWKILIPVSVVWLMLVATVRALRNDGYDFNSLLLSVAGAVIAILLISFVVDIFRDRSAKGAGRNRHRNRDPRSTRWRADSRCRRCPDRPCRRYRDAGHGMSGSSLSVGAGYSE